MRIFYDVDTQKDFINPDGALYVPGAELLKPNLKELTDFAFFNGITILGSADRHFGTEEYKDMETELAKWGGPFPNHCMDGTEGQKKIPETRIEKAITSHVPSQRLSVEELGNFNPHYQIIHQKRRPFQQIIFEKQSYDVFPGEENLGHNRNIDEVLAMLGASETIVYGVATDYCVKAAAIGFRERGFEVYVVSDAIRAVSPETGEEALEEMLKAGVNLITTAEVLEDK